MLRHEVLAARAVVSPNVCRIFDLVEVDGQELVSMEYVDGTTLLDLLQENGRPRVVEGRGDRLAVPGRPGGDPRGGAGAPGLQAREPDGDACRPGAGDGLRDRQGGSGSGDRDSVGDAGLHGAGAGTGRCGGRSHRCLSPPGWCWPSS